MNNFILSSAFFFACLSFSFAEDADDEGWVSLFDGKTLEGWKASENKSSFSVVDGKIMAYGPRSHLFYVGKINGGKFENFEWKADVMTTRGSNSGMYFHTEYQEKGWPRKGYEAQVNNTHRDPRKTASLYGVKDNHKAPVKDDEWFTQHVIVNGKQITIKVNGKTVVDFTEPEGVTGGRKLSTGTFAFQGHDPKSKVFYRNILVKVLPE
ncbi:MAG: DUF1080 domain-containing protein [Planctomycetota bacterium]|jgi:hypothetical protein|nr:DUF1080 domain-containing protein [Planctomycetota bacterium]MDP7254853.1 DUF1080 domain-containing protein [Planctomycetota bacterium]